MKSRWTWVLTSVAVAGGLLLLGLALSCAGRGVTYVEIEKPLRETCANCHDKAKVKQLQSDVAALDNALFTAERFPAKNFPSGLSDKATKDLILKGDPPEDAHMDPNLPAPKAWITHEFNELARLLEDPVPPDYSTDAKMSAFISAKTQQSYEGCEMADKLDKGFVGNGDGMPPLWAEELLKLLKREFTPLTPADRQKIKDYVNGVLPGGVRACKSVVGSS